VTGLSEGFDFNSALKELDKSETHLTVRVAHKLKERLATGGTAKEGVIMLQGDHRARIKAELIKLGFPDDHIEIF
jgi:translation initiation factor 1